MEGRKGPSKTDYAPQKGSLSNYKRLLELHLDSLEGEVCLQRDTKVEGIGFTYYFLCYNLAASTQVTQEQTIYLITPHRVAMTSWQWYKVPLGGLDLKP